MPRKVGGDMVTILGKKFGNLVTTTIHSLGKVDMGRVGKVGDVAIIMRNLIDKLLT